MTTEGGILKTRKKKKMLMWWWRSIKENMNIPSSLRRMMKRIPTRKTKRLSTPLLRLRILLLLRLVPSQVQCSFDISCKSIPSPLHNTKTKAAARILHQEHRPHFLLLLLLHHCHRRMRLPRLLLLSLRIQSQLDFLFDLAASAAASAAAEAPNHKLLLPLPPPEEAKSNYKREWRNRD
jgi:hypothetical protein